MKIKPLNGMVLIKRIVLERKDDFILPTEDRGNGAAREGIVVATGGSTPNKSGLRVQSDLDAGDRVMYSQYDATEIVEKGETFVLIEESAIMLVLND